MAVEDTSNYEGNGKLMSNYGWVENTSNLSTVRDTVDLIDEQGMNHNALMRAIYEFRESKGDLKSKWTWDARCRIKAVCATGMVELDRNIQGYRLTELGKELQATAKGSEIHRGKRILTNEEKNIFQRGLLTNPPVIRVLTILNDSRKKENGPLSKYDVGSQLGFVGDVGFTHFDAEFVVESGKNFNDAEGDADKWARTIISWLSQVGWVIKSGKREIDGKSLQLFTTTYDVDSVLQYKARSTVKYIPQEMLCSNHHPFASLIQQRRIAILKILAKKKYVTISDLLTEMINQGIDTDEETLAFDVLNLRQAGICIYQERSCYSLKDKIKLDVIPENQSVKNLHMRGIEKTIEHYVMVYANTLPPKMVDSLIRYGYAGTKSAALFESTVEQMFSYMGYETIKLGQGHGKVTDVIAKYRDKLYAKSYGLIIDAKAYEKYNFGANDVRKMKDYISLHGPELMKDQIPQHAFAFISMDFTPADEHLEEIANDTGVNGTAIDVYELMELGSAVMTKEVDIANIYSSFTTNKRYSCSSIGIYDSDLSDGLDMVAEEKNDYGKKE